MYWQAFGHRRRYDLRVATPADYNIPHESLEVRTNDGLKLHGWFCPGTLPAAVIISGGYRSPSGDVLGITAALQRIGFTVAVYGWRGTPGSDQAMHTLGVYERNDLIAVIDAVSARMGKVPLGLLGYSMGGSVSISVAATDPRIAAVCADSAFADPTALLKDRIHHYLRLPTAAFIAPVVAVFARRTGARLSDFKPVNIVAQISPRPLLLIHGKNDGIVGVEHARRLYRAAGKPKSMWLLPGIDHVSAYFANRDKYVEKVGKFFRDSLLKSESE